MLLIRKAFMIELLILLVLIACDSLKCEASQPLPTCRSKDFHYAYTDCDERGGRWRVAVPEPGVCVGGAPPPPLRGKNCSFSCESGQFLDMTSQQCQDCPPGSFSLGDGMLYDDFDVRSLPVGFHIVNKKITFQSFYESATGVVPGGSAGGSLVGGDKIAGLLIQNCSECGWKTFRGYLVFKPCPGCESTLSFSTKLARSGQLAYKYHYSDPETIFSFNIRNEQCLSYGGLSLGSGRFYSSPPETKDKEFWRTMEVDLNEGSSVILWKAGTSSLSKSHRAEAAQAAPIVIAFISVTGLSYASECRMCPGGTFSRGGSSACVPCAPGTYAEPGWDSCKPCDRNKEFSGPRADKCSTRPPCGREDYYEYYTPCDENMMTTKVFKWVKPKICREDLKESVVRFLPPPSSPEKCPPCNPGMQPNGQGCKICPKNHFSDGNSECRKCEAHTAPNYGYQFRWWGNLPPNVETNCQHLDQAYEVKNPCSKDFTPWMLAANRIHTAPTRRRNILFLLSVRAEEGFANAFMSGDASEQNPYGHVVFVFKTRCEGECHFFFIDESYSDSEPIGHWVGGTNEKTSYSYPITNPGPTTFSWFFLPSSGMPEDGGSESLGLDPNSVISQDEASIFYINVTNAVGGGASTCIPCPKSAGRECVPCPRGHYIREETHECIKCPEDSYLNVSSTGVGVDSCIPCGKNLKSHDGVQCATNCNFTLANQKFDFTSLKGAYLVKGMQIFGRDGSMYYHMFNLSFCSQEKVVCHENATFKIRQKLFSAEGVSTILCRSTAIPPMSSEDSLMFMNSFSIANELVGITTEDSFGNLSVNKEFVGEHEYPDAHFYYKSNRATANCPRGRGAILTVRCDPLRNETEVLIPPKCPDGTCDGCTFHLMLKSRSGCPVCRKQDYRRIVGECDAGVQEVHYIPDKHCIYAGEDKMKVEKQKCKIFSRSVQIVIACSAGLTLLLITLVIYVWKKNRKLEYKYMRLVNQSATGQYGKEGELPAAESCGLDEEEEDEDDEDRVKFEDGLGGKKTNRGIFKKMRLGTRGVQKTESQEMNLTLDMDD